MIVIAALFCCCSAQAQSETRVIPYDPFYNLLGDTTTKIHYTYQILDGKLTGSFKSFYIDGKLKATGVLENGLPKGEWKVFFEDGSLALQRFYHSPAEFEPIFPPLPKKGPAALFGHDTPAPLERDTAGFIRYKPIKEMDIYWEKRIYRWLPQGPENRALFENDRLWNTLWNAIQQNELPLYTAEDARFKKRLSYDSLQSMGLDWSQLQFSGLEIKEIYFFDKERLTMDVRILGLRPVFFDRQKQDTIRLFWVYYPQARGLLAHVKWTDPALPAQIKNLDDVFYFRHFSGQIYEETNVYDRGAPNYFHEESKLTRTESEAIEREILEADYELWAYFNSKAFKKKH